jgi:hypothetical protein
MDRISKELKDKKMSTHITCSRIMNGIGGSGDFARNARINIFATGKDRGDVYSPRSLFRFQLARALPRDGKHEVI